jgi:hypothetical protein
MYNHLWIEGVLQDVWTIKTARHTIFPVQIPYKSTLLCSLVDVTINSKVIYQCSIQPSDEHTCNTARRLCTPRSDGFMWYLHATSILKSDRLVHKIPKVVFHGSLYPHTKIIYGAKCARIA